MERQSPQTNIFYLPVGEMAVTLQDVTINLGLNIGGPTLMDLNIVGQGRRWVTWPNCYDKLLRGHLVADIVYIDPQHLHITMTFKMGQTAAQACMPLRLIRWRFCRESYMDLRVDELIRHLCAYVLFLLGSFLLLDTLGSEVHLQYLPFLKGLDEFITLSIGRVVLAYLYQELYKST